MNIQIFGTKKSSDTRKAERFFKERGTKFQSIDLNQKGLSKGEFNSVMQAVGGIEAMIDPDCKDKDLLALVTYISADQREEKVMENQSVITSVRGARGCGRPADDSAKPKHRPSRQARPCGRGARATHRQPIVRNGRQATVGYAPEVWKNWQ